MTYVYKKVHVTEIQQFLMNQKYYLKTNLFDVIHDTSSRHQQLTPIDFGVRKVRI